MYNVTLSEQDLNNLKIFLERVTLTGKEVLAYNLIIKSIYDAKPTEGEKTKKVGE